MNKFILISAVLLAVNGLSLDSDNERSPRHLFKKHKGGGLLGLGLLGGGGGGGYGENYHQEYHPPANYGGHGPESGSFAASAAGSVSHGHGQSQSQSASFAFGPFAASLSQSQSGGGSGKD